MKSKLRKLTIEINQYLYIVTKDYDFSCDVYLRIFLFGYKKTPVSFYFSSIYNPVSGNPFFTGINLLNKTTQQEELFNINMPGFVTKLINYAIQNGWTGKNNTDVINGIKVLQSWNYDTSKIPYYFYDKEQQKTIIKYYS